MRTGKNRGFQKGGCGKDDLAFAAVCAWMDYLTMQRSKIFNEKLYAYLKEEETEGAKFCEQHPEAAFVAKEMRQVFRNMEMDITASETKADQRRIALDAYRELDGRLVKRFSTFTMGLEDMFFTFLSGETYEKAGTDGQSIVVLPSLGYLQRYQGENGVVCFGENARIKLWTENVKAIRKQLNMAGTGLLAVYKDFTDNDFYTAGLLPRSFCGLLPRVNFPRRGEWEFCLHGRSCFRCRNGMFLFPQLDLKVETEKEIQSKLPSYSRETIKRISGIVEGIDRLEHGAVAVFIDETYIVDKEYILEKECKRLVLDGGRGVLIEKPIDLWEDGMEMLEALTSIDGAILLDFSGRCYACGVILDGESQRKGNLSRGARYNSTKTYVESFCSHYGPKRALGIVKSDDKMINLLDGIMGHNI